LGEFAKARSVRQDGKVPKFPFPARRSSSPQRAEGRVSEVPWEESSGRGEPRAIKDERTPAMGLGSVGNLRFPGIWAVPSAAGFGSEVPFVTPCRGSGLSIGRFPIFLPGNSPVSWVGPSRLEWGLAAWRILQRQSSTRRGLYLRIGRISSLLRGKVKDLRVVPLGHRSTIGRTLDY